MLESGITHMNRIIKDLPVTSAFIGKYAVYIVIKAETGHTVSWEKGGTVAARSCK
jgi:hypothetical protein